MDRNLRDTKIESLRHCLARIAAKRPATVTQLVDDFDLQDILAVNLERAVQICVDLAAMRVADLGSPPPATMAETFELLAKHRLISAPTAERMQKAVGFRNIAVHRYAELDWNIVFTIAHQHLADFESFAREFIQSDASPAPRSTEP